MSEDLNRPARSDARDGWAELEDAHPRDENALRCTIAGAVHTAPSESVAFFLEHAGVGLTRAVKLAAAERAFYVRDNEFWCETKASALGTQIVVYELDRYRGATPWRTDASPAQLRVDVADLVLGCLDPRA